jgi:hypothetical protein
MQDWPILSRPTKFLLKPLTVLPWFTQTHFRMKRLPLIVIIVLFSSFANGQSPLYEKGYFIDSQGGKTECYIKMEDWNEQHGIHYHLNLRDSPKFAEINRVKGFGIRDNLKYIKVKANIDISGDEEGLLSLEQNPEWQEEELFLRTLVEGKINLYAFEAKYGKRYFFNEESSPVEQLVFKKYRTPTGIQTNLTYQNTLFRRFNCMDSTERYFKAIKYSSTDLTKVFEMINSCEGAASIIYETPLEALVVETGSIELPQVRKRAGAADTQEKKKPTGLTNHYLGIAANQLLRQLFNFGGTNSPFSVPYLLQYAINSKKNGKGFNIGMAYDRNSITDNSNSNGTTRKTINSNFSFRMGYDYKKDWGKRWIGIFGADFLIDRSKSKTDNLQTGTPFFTIETSSKGWGIGPRFGLLFRISDKILLGTDAAYYFRSTIDFQSIPDQPRSTQKLTSFTLSLPVTVFLTVKIKG